MWKNPFSINEVGRRSPAVLYIIDFFYVLKQIISFIPHSASNNKLWLIKSASKCTPTSRTRWGQGFIIFHSFVLRATFSRKGHAAATVCVALGEGQRVSEEHNCLRASRYSARGSMFAWPPLPRRNLFARIRFSSVFPAAKNICALSAANYFPYTKTHLSTLLVLLLGWLYGTPRRAFFGQKRRVVITNSALPKDVRLPNEAHAALRFWLIDWVIESTPSLGNLNCISATGWVDEMSCSMVTYSELS